MAKYNVDNLTLDEKIGQLLMFGFDALELNDHAIDLIKNYHFGNIILFTRNVKTMKQLFDLNKNLQKLAMASLKIPLFISIDQEGGMVTRLKSGGTYFPGAMTLSASNSSENSYLCGKFMGKELVSLGFNMDLAPVLDVNNNPLNPVIGVRSFSDNPKVVSEYGIQFMKGLQENVIATAKHFPGHGDTNTDSHLALPKISHGVKRLDAVELYPFKKAIDNGIKAIMSSHINFPAYTDFGLPTTLSKKCLTGLLREKLGFKGIIMTDCMEMKAIQNNYTTEKASLMAIKAGANLICLSHTKKLQVASYKKIREAVLAGELTEETLNERVQLLLDNKEDIDLSILNQEYDEVKHIVENNNTLDFSYQVVKSAASLVRGKQFTKKTKTLIIAVTPSVTTIADEEAETYDIISTINKTLIDFDTLSISIRPTSESIKNTIIKASQYEQVVVCSYNANIYKAQLELVKKLKTLNMELSVIAMRNPYDFISDKTIENYVCFYEYTPNSVNALIEYLKGELQLTGKVPIAYE